MAQHTPHDTTGFLRVFVGGSTLWLLLCVITALLFSSGCAQPVGTEGLRLLLSRPLSPYRYVTTPELEPALRTAVGELKRATGLPLEVIRADDAGAATPVSAADPELLTTCDVDTNSGEETCSQSCAWTLVEAARSGKVVGVEILIAEPLPPGCLPKPRVLIHELIHSVLRGYETDGMLHTETGVFSAVSNHYDSLINEEVLTTVCAHVPCALFNPEIEE